MLRAWFIGLFYGVVMGMRLGMLNEGEGVLR